MTLVNRIKSVVRRLTVREPDGWVSQASLSESGESVTETSALALSAVWACTNLLAGTIASLPLMVYKQENGYRVPAKDHFLYRILHDSPNFDQTALDFWEFICASIELRGDGFAAIERSGDRIVGLIPVAPELMSVKRGEAGSLVYSWTDEGRYFEKTDADVLHIRGFGGSPLGGMSTLQFARNSFGIARALDRSAGTTFKNGLRPSGALVFSEFLSKENREIAENRLTEKFMGASNTGRPLILEGGTSWQPLTLNPDDAQMLESRRFSVEEICRFFGVPPHMVGHTENSTSWGSGLGEQTLGFQKFTLRRRLKRIEQAVMKQLLTPADRAAGITVEFNVEGLLRADSAGRAAFYKSGLNDGWLTINQVCEWENLPPVEGGDVNRVQMQNVPITEAGNDIAN